VAIADPIHSPTAASRDAFAPPVFDLAQGSRLRLTWGGFSRPAAAKANEDFYALMFPSAGESQRGEVLVALADGLSADGSARAIIESVTLGVVNDFYATPAGWTVAHALDRLLASANDWVWAHNARGRGDAITGAISVMVLQGSRYYLAHVGDTRVYRIGADGQFKQLTTDHVWPRHDLRHVLRRALGLDSHLVVDFADGELAPGEVFLMVTDGVWEVLGERRMREILARGQDPAATANALVSAAHERQATYMGRNDATAIVLGIERV
jgi:protein phosphatase